MPAFVTVPAAPAIETPNSAPLIVALASPAPLATLPPSASTTPAPTLLVMVSPSALTPEDVVNAETVPSLAMLPAPASIRTPTRPPTMLAAAVLATEPPACSTTPAWLPAMVP